MQYAVRGGTEQQREPMPAVTADHHEIDGLLLRDAMNFRFGSAEDEITMFGGHADGGSEFGEMRLRLSVDLFLHGGEVHRDVATVGETQRFDDVDDVQFGFEAFCERDRSAGDAVGLFREVYR